MKIFKSENPKMEVRETTTLDLICQDLTWLIRQINVPTLRSAAVDINRTNDIATINISTDQRYHIKIGKNQEAVHDILQQLLPIIDQLVKDNG